MKRIPFLIKNLLLSNFKRLRSPYKMTFALTYRCNLRCKICRIWERKYGQELTVDEIGRIFKSLYNLSWIDLTGGEISLREDLLDVVRAIAENSRRLYIFHISTNGQLLKRIYSLVEEVLKRGIMPVVNIGIDGPRHVNDELKGKTDAYGRSIETFRMLRRLKKGYYYISATISDYNVIYLDEFMVGLEKDIPGFSSSELHFNIFHNSSHYYGNQDVMGSSDLDAETVKKYYELTRGGGIIKSMLEDSYLKGLLHYLGGKNHPLDCQALKSTCFLDPYGAVYPCGIFNSVAGDLKEHGYDINSLWRSSNACGVRRSIEERRCKGCWSPCEAYPAILGSLSVVLRSYLYDSFVGGPSTRRRGVCTSSGSGEGPTASF